MSTTARTTSAVPETTTEMYTQSPSDNTTSQAPITSPSESPHQPNDTNISMAASSSTPNFSLNPSSNIISPTLVSSISPTLTYTTTMPSQTAVNPASSSVFPTDTEYSENTLSTSAFVSTLPTHTSNDCTCHSQEEEKTERTGAY